MARYDQKAETWTGDSRIKGFPRRQRRGFETEEEARQWEQDRRLRLLFPEKAVTLLKTSQASLDYLKSCKRKKYGHNTLRDKKNVLKQFTVFVGLNLLLKDVKTYHVSKFLDLLYDKRLAEFEAWQKEEKRLEADPAGERKKGIRKKPVDPGKNANRFRKQLSFFFNHYIKKQIIKSNPAHATDTYDEYDFKKYVPPGGDIDLIKSIADPDELDIIRVFMLSGARAGELRAMQFEDYYPDQKKIKIWTTKRQGSKKESHMMEIGDNMKEILDRRMATRKKNCPWIFPNPSGGKMPKASLDNLMPRLCQRAIEYLEKTKQPVNFKPFTAHSFRHYMAVQIYLRKGLGETQKFLRHKRATTTDIYIRSLIDIDTIPTGPVTDDIENSLIKSDPTGKIRPLFR